MRCRLVVYVILAEVLTIKEQDFINFLRVYKHDFLNHLQVIQGYLQLKKPELALKYLKEATIEIENHGSAMKLQLSSVSLWLLLKENEHRELGIIMDLDCDSTFSTSPDQEEVILSLLKGLVEVITVELGKLPYEQRNWGLSFTGQNKLEIIITLPKGDEADWEEIFNQKVHLPKEMEIITQSNYNEKNFIYQLELQVS